MKLYRTTRYKLHSDKTYFIPKLRIFILTDNSKYTTQQANDGKRVKTDWTKVYPNDFEKIDYETVSNI